MKKIIIYTDGSSLGNPGPGGWGAIVASVDFDKVVEIGGADKQTTNNKMELMAVIRALESLDEKFDGEVIVNTDSSYVVNGITVWIKNWKANNWKKKDKKDVLNRELWKRLSRVAEKFKIKWNRIDGHSGIAGNERADAIAVSFAADKTLDLYSGSMTDYYVDVS